MRTTINVDADILEKLRAESVRSRRPLREVLNETLRHGLERTQPESAGEEYRTPVFSMGFPPVGNMDKALQLAAQLEDEEIIHKLQLRK